jgi:hypothetical protein
MPDRPSTRREFLIQTGALAALPVGQGSDLPGRVPVIAFKDDLVASSDAARWAIRDLEQTLAAAGPADLSIIAAGPAAPAAAAALKAAGLAPPSHAEALVLLETRTERGPAILACGADGRGLAYALTELADRLRHGGRPALALKVSVVERPANPVRSIMRQFTSELLDKPWFHDREMWPRYLDLLATHRFNRFHLAFGFGYDALHDVADSYFLFLYPFLLAVPGYHVRVTHLPDAERQANLEMLQFISSEANQRGIDFELGVWTHGYRWTASPLARYNIEGLTAETHAPYCRDALAALLQACPAISSVGLRIHGESGVAEGSYAFWKTVFDGVRRAGRPVEIDLHAKGIDAAMIENALATGLPVNISPKYWAEHLGMPYHQAAIRDLEMPVPGRAGAGLMTLSEGARSFTRYGYADLLREDRRYTVRHRVFSGTQRLLLSGDPEWTAAWSRAFQFCGSTGADLMEPLTCRGRRGTAVPGRRDGYLDERLATRWDWQKYAYWYRVWGRFLYNPATDAAVARRDMSEPALASAIASASRILPIVTTVHLPSAACDAYWPEIYWNQPLADEPAPNPYTDTPSPKTFSNVSPLDPQMFSRMSDFAGELLGGQPSGKYSPLDVARWLENFAGVAEKGIRVGSQAGPDLRRAAIDIEIQAGLGRFFAARFRSGVLYAIFERTHDRRALEAALSLYRLARSFWAALAKLAQGVYAADLSASDRLSERGQWLDRLEGIDRDIAQLQQRLASAQPGDDARVTAALDTLRKTERSLPALLCRHQPPAGFRRKQPLEIGIAAALASARLHYRHVNQAERYQAADMESASGQWSARIPAAYTDSPFPIQYYFTLREAAGRVTLYPGFGPTLARQPYYVVRAAD